MTDSEMPMGRADGLCECGCGEVPPIAWRNVTARGYVKGEPIRYIRGHQTRKKDASDYREISRGSRKDRVRMKEHVLIAEAAIGKPLPEGAVVHHFDGNRRNNARTNLVICQDHAYHMLLHKRQRAYEACGNPDARRCVFCAGYNDQHLLVMHRPLRGGRQPNYCHPRCRYLWKRDRRRAKRAALNGTVYSREGTTEPR